MENPIMTLTMADGGKIVCELYPDKAPQSVRNMISLANKGFYDGLIFHRVISGFMIQGGCPKGTGTGGPGYCIKGEFKLNGVKNNLSHKRGVLSMARAQAANSAGSQFFIMHEDGEFLDGQYAAFGKVLEGMDVVDKIAAVKTDGNDRPLTEQKIAVLRKVTERTGTQATIISDPLNGSMYAETLFNANMLYPIINARTDVPSAPFGKVETAFASGDAQQVLGTVCPLTDAPEYFLTMGDQAQSLQSFPYRAQYDSFHNEELIDTYVDGGTLVKVADYSQYGQGWALYRFGCTD